MSSTVQGTAVAMKLAPGLTSSSLPGLSPSGCRPRGVGGRGDLLRHRPRARGQRVGVCPPPWASWAMPVTCPAAGAESQGEQERGPPSCRSPRGVRSQSLCPSFPALAVATETPHPPQGAPALLLGETQPGGLLSQPSVASGWGCFHSLILPSGLVPNSQMVWSGLWETPLGVGPTPPLWPEST